MQSANILRKGTAKFRIGFCSSRKLTIYRSFNYGDRVPLWYTTIVLNARKLTVGRRELSVTK